MAYVPATAVPMIMSQNTAFRAYSYSSTDSAATVSADDYFSDGKTRGMKQGDAVFLTNPTSGVTVFTYAAFA